MIKILCVCGNGMGTSTILKISLNEICQRNHINAYVESCAFGEAMTYLMDKDLIVSSPEWISMLPKTDAKIVSVKNLIDKSGVEAALLEEIKDSFPEEYYKQEE